MELQRRRCVLPKIWEHSPARDGQ